MVNELPKYWGSLEELAGSPEFQESIGKEFLSPPLEEELSPMERRDFLKIMGAGIFMATLACSRKPVEKIIPYVNKPDAITPGVPNWYASTCGECAASCGVLVKTREGRPIKLEGNPNHPVSRGALCARGQASLLNLYDPDRLQGPVAVDRDRGTFEKASWEQIDAAVVRALSKIKQSGQGVAFLTGVVNGPASRQLIQDFLARFGESRWVSYEAVVPEEIGLGQELAYGRRMTPRYRIEQAKLIVGFGADFLGTWLSPVEFAKVFPQGRKVAEGVFPNSFASNRLCR